MKPGTRALGVAVSASDRERRDPDGDADGNDPSAAPTRATVAGAVVSADRVVDGLSFSTCTVGGTDATDAICDLFERLARDDVRHLLLAGVAPAWFNVVDLRAVNAAAARPVLAVSFEASDGLEPHLREHFSGEALDRRLSTYEALPERVPVNPSDTGDGDAETPASGRWVRAVGVDADDARRIVRAYTPDGRRRPDPLRVAALAARAGRGYADRERADAVGDE